ncbi:hypothetical protein LOK49_LG08G02834 [Camellia lanceoleosa]|uniref:Uncharacterized protein n=1 Tax=Camellia lanceoleosa TaxID=1840588 RepID=A0ACC0GQ37_9ERIC|nr:hypothetical protein LOK49_LG08G02834 [Camellia lanceoleosa]
MACLSMEGFVGNGALKRVLPKLTEEGWDDVPTLKLMKPEDMDAFSMTQQQKIRRLNVTMNDLTLVEIVQPGEDLAR